MVQQQSSTRKLYLLLRRGERRIGCNITLLLLLLLLQTTAFALRKYSETKVTAFRTSKTSAEIQSSRVSLLLRLLFHLHNTNKSISCIYVRNKDSSSTVGAKYSYSSQLVQPQQQQQQQSPRFSSLYNPLRCVYFIRPLMDLAGSFFCEKTEMNFLFLLSSKSLCCV